jgi:Tol biopolymer transport system component
LGLLMRRQAAVAADQNSLSGHGQALIAYGHTLAVRDLYSGVERVLVQVPSQEFVYDPLWMPDGRTFLYVDQKAFNGDRSVDWGSDIWQTDVAGNRELVLAHDTKGADIDGLSLSADGASLYFGYTRTDVSPAGTYLGQLTQVRRLDLASGRVSTVVDGGLDPAISPDGTTLAYLYVDAPDDASFGMWTSAADGSNPRPLVTGAQQLIEFFTPRFSPDGSRILFTAAVNTLTPVGAAPNRPATVESYAGAEDGLPQDAWVVDADRTNLTRLTTLYEDQPSAAWSSDGSQVAVLGSTGLYLMSADGSGLTRLGDGYLHGELGWRDGP